MKTSSRTFKEGQKFSRFTISEAYTHKNPQGIWLHKMICDCGSIRYICGSDVKTGRYNSCGCLRLELATTHSLTHTPEYSSWSGMLQRCTNKNHVSYKNYMQRGITVCKSWVSFENFIRDMGVKPGEQMSLERVDNDKGYSKDNCIWADKSTQAINQRIRSDNKTGVKGVSFRKDNGTYVASINRNHIKTHLGCFKTIEEAATARRLAEKEYLI